MSSNNDLSSVSINDIISKNDKKSDNIEKKTRKDKKTDSCQELKNIAYKTMLLNRYINEIIFMLGYKKSSK